MPSCRAVIKDALRALKVLAPGDDVHIDQLNAGLSGLQNLILELHEARGPLVDVDVSADYVANENQRCRIQAGDTVTVTLPNSVPIWPTYDPADYGFTGGSSTTTPGSTGVADGASFRQPCDGARIEVVGTTQGLWFYRADLNAWANAYGIGLDDEVPLNGRYAGPLGAFLAERIEDELSVKRAQPRGRAAGGAGADDALPAAGNPARPGAGGLLLISTRVSGGRAPASSLAPSTASRSPSPEIGGGSIGAHTWRRPDGTPRERWGRVAWTRWSGSRSRG